MKRFLMLISALVLITGCSTPPLNEQNTSASNRVLLAIFAHPDDETTVSPVLAKYAAEGVEVHLAIATDGRYGVTAHAGIPAGDSLARARAAELKCAAEKLGVHPILFGLHDQLKMQGGYEPVHAQLSELRSRVTTLFDSLKPDVVITWGASGWTGHHDHRLVSAVVTEVYESKAWDHPMQLFYPAIPTGKIPSGSAGFATVDSTYLNVRISTSAEDQEKANASLHCHQSQYTPQVMDQMRAMISAALGNTTYFKSHNDEKVRTSLF
jgi:LmbE family N-acetylglucosaminyl deacetylase